MGPQLKMLRPDLAGLPEVVMPDGYTLRHFREGDGPAWTTILCESFESTPDKFSFDRIMRADIAFMPRRIWFVTHNDIPIATASAYTNPSFMADAGFVHYVGIQSEHKGRKLGYQVSLAALHQMVAEGWTRAWLSTDDFRLPAIRIYLDLGFEPLLVHENQRQRWQDVFKALGSAVDANRYQSMLQAPLYDQTNS